MSLMQGGQTIYAPTAQALQAIMQADQLTLFSDLRQVPDTQEVFLYPDSDVSIIFEILQVVTEGPAATDLREAAK
jgi:hypothetical protein